MKISHFMSATALASCAIILPNGAFAQTTPTPGDTTVAPDTANGQASASANADGSEKSGDIVVTGSRIRNSRYRGADPVTVLTRDDATANGYSTTTDLLQSNAVTNGTSQINNAYGGYVTNGGPGANTLSLRGLGTSRTLILLNGRRLAPSGSRGAVGAADLNSLPNAMVERVEVLNSGASSIYGSDAVAGVINVITRRHINGIELSGEVNVPQVGAGVQKRIALLFGASGDRFTIDGSLEYYKRDGLAFDDRAYLQCGIGGRYNGTGGGYGSGDFVDPATGQPKCYGLSNGTGDQGLTINTIGLPGVLGSQVALAPGAPAGYNGTCNRFRPNPAVTTGAYPGYECVGGGTLSLDIRDSFPQSLLKQSLISPTENYNGFLSASYKLNSLGDAELYFEGLASRRNSSQVGERQFTIDYNQGSLLLPTAFRNLNFSGACPNTNYPTCPAGGAIAVRVFANYGNYNSYQTSDFVKAAGGLRGNLPGNFHYDFYASKSWADASYTTDLILTSRLTQALDVVASGNGFACRNATGGCVAAPVFSNAIVGGDFSGAQAFFNYVVAPVTGNTKFRETTFSLNVDGPLFALPGGTAKIALGAERRSQRIDDSPSTESVNNNLYGFTSSTPTRGSDTVTEVYGELELPILHDQIIHDLTISGSARYTNYRSYGDNTTYKVGGTLAPTNWLLFRGSYGTSFRAPQLFEQFLGSTSGFQSGLGDPCYTLTAQSNPTRVKNCAADGVGLGFQQNSGIQVNQIGGAASGLKPETSRNINFGGVLSPRFGNVELSLSVDYFNLKVRNGVSQLSYTTILSQCYDDPIFRSNPICNLVIRNPTSLALTVNTGYVNISTAKLRGIDYSARIALPLGPGRLTLNGQVTQNLERYNQNLPTSPIVSLVNVYNGSAYPRFTGVFDGTYALDQFSVHYSVEWTQGITGTNAYAGGGPTYNFNTPDYFLHTVSATFRTADKKFAMTLGVRNLFDTTPPFVSSGYVNRIGNGVLYSGYDVVGRTFFMNVSTKF